MNQKHLVNSPSLLPRIHVGLNFLLRSWSWCLIGFLVGGLSLCVFQVFGIAEQLPGISALMAWSPIVRIAGYLAGILGIAAGTGVALKMFDETGCFMLAVIWSLGLLWIFVVVPMIVAYFVEAALGRFMAAGIVGSMLGSSIAFAAYLVNKSLHARHQFKQ